MPKLHIPHLRDKFVLTEDWTFNLHNESRNKQLIEHFNIQQFEKTERFKDRWGYMTYDWVPVKVTIPEGSGMYIDRYYIKNGARDFDSCTFRVKFPGERTTKRFWAKLDDVNTMVVQFIEEAA